MYYYIESVCVCVCITIYIKYMDIGICMFAHGHLQRVVMRRDREKDLFLLFLTFLSVSLVPTNMYSFSNLYMVK